MDNKQILKIKIKIKKNKKIKNKNKKCEVHASRECIFSSICVIPVQIKVNTLCTPKSKTHMAITSILYNPFEGRRTARNV